MGEKAWRVEGLRTNQAMEEPYVAHIGSLGSEGASFPAQLQRLMLQCGDGVCGEAVVSWGYIPDRMQVLDPGVPGVQFWLCNPRGFCHLSTKAGK